MTGANVLFAFDTRQGRQAGRQTDRQSGSQVIMHSSQTKSLLLYDSQPVSRGVHAVGTAWRRAEVNAALGKYTDSRTETDSKTARQRVRQTDSRQTRRKICFLVSHLHCAIVGSHFNVNFHFPVCCRIAAIAIAFSGVRVKVKSICTFTHTSLTYPIPR